MKAMEAPAPDTTLTSRFASALLARYHGPLPEPVVHEVRRAILNVLGTTISASRSPELDSVVTVYEHAGPPEVAVPGRGEKLERHLAALAIGLAGHRDDFDDTHPVCLIHASASAFGAVYPLALLGGVSGTEFLAAVTVAIESQLRVGMAMTPSHYDIGWHITGTCGVIGAAVAAGALRRLEPTRLADAIALAGGMAIGHREGFGTFAKPYHSGKAASNGLFAADMAAHGLARGALGLDAERGYLAVMSETVDLTFLEPEDIAARWILRENTYKAFPCGVVAHPAIHAAIGLHARVSDPVAEIASIEVHCHPLVVELMGRPTATTGLEAKFCAVHGVAVGLIDGTAGLAQFSDERARDSRVEALRSRTRLVVEPAMPLQAVRLTVRRHDGPPLVNAIDDFPGSLTRPLTDDELWRKFRTLVDPIMPGRAQRLADLVMSLGETISPRDLGEALSV